MKLLTNFILLIALIALHLSSTATPVEKERNKLLFLENRGQLIDQNHQPRTDIDYKVDGGGVTIFVGNGQLHYQWVRSQSEKVKVKSKNTIKVNQEEAAEKELSIYRMDVTLVDANKQSTPIAEAINPYQETYYLPQFDDGVTAKSYTKITYPNIYPHIDWVLYSNGRELKYDFVVHQGGKVSDIQLHYDGATTLQLQDGALVATTPYGSLTEAAPYTYTKTGKEKINSAYTLKGNILQITTETTDQEIIIDPSLLWTTFYGGSSNDYGTDVATDRAGNVYIVGYTSSTGNIATTGAHQTTYMISQTGQIGPFDAYVAKFNEAGVRQWGTYYAGSENDEFNAIAVSPEGDVYAAGTTENFSNISTSNGYKKTTPSTASNLVGSGMLVKFNSSGVRQWGTYYGGGSTIDVAVDDSAYIYITGETASTDSIASSGSYQDTLNTNQINSFIAKFHPNGSRIWGTYYSDNNGGIQLFNITCDHDGNIYVGGRANNTNNTAATTGVHQTSLAGNNEGILAKFSNDGQQRLWATFIGNTGHDEIHGIACDDDNNPYIIGTTRGFTGTNNITSTGAHSTTYNGGVEDAFIVKFTPNGVRQWGTFYGGSSIDGGNGITISAAGQVQVFGFTRSSNGIATTGALQSTVGSTQSSFLALFNPNSGQRIWGSYYGYGGTGRPNEITYNSDLCVTYKGITYATSVTAYTSLATTGAHQTTYGGSNIDAYLSAFIIDTVAYIKEPFTDTVLCPLDTLRIPFGVNTAFNSGNSFFIQLSNASGSFASPVIIGTKSANSADTVVCVIPKNTPAGTGYRLRITSNSPLHSFTAMPIRIRIKAAPQAFSNSSNSPVCAGDTLHLNGTTTSTGVSWSWAGVGSFSSSAEDTIITNVTAAAAGDYILTATLNSTGCSFKDTTTVLVKPLPNKPTASSNGPLCTGDTLQLTSSSSTSGVSYSWAGTGSYTSNAQNPTVSTNATSTLSGSYINTVTLNGCVNKDTVNVVVHPVTPTPTAGSNSPLCATQNLNLTATNIAGATYTWWGPNGFSANTQNPVRPNATGTHIGAYYVLATVNGCASDTDSVQVVVNPDPQVTVVPTPSNDVCAGEQVTFVTYTNNAGASPSFRWLINNIAVATSGTSYATNTLQNGDVVSCEMTSTGTCKSSFVDTSNAINMTVSPVLVPSVSISANPGLVVAPWELVTFTATPTNGGTSPTYQWLRNGQPVQGATNATWGTFQLSDGDTISVVLYSDYKCAQPDTATSNQLIVQLKLGIDKVNTLARVSLFPNPNKGSFTITGKVATQERIRLSIINSVGQVVHQQEVSTTTGALNEQITTNNLPSGVYLLQLQAGNDKQHIRFTIN